MITFAYSAFAGFSQSDTQITPGETDNFYEACVRLCIPKSVKRIAATVVFLNGTDSDARSIVSQPEWQAFAAKNNLALVGCYFRGDGEPYESAAAGSGEALLQMVRRLSEQTKRPDLRAAQLIFIGHSSGAMFAYNFTTWKPESVLAFVSIKSGPISPSDNVEAAKIPGLFIVGEHDLEGRVRSVAKAYLSMAEGDRKWAIAMEPGGGHGSSEKIRDLTRVYIEDILSLSKLGKLPLKHDDVGEYGAALHLVNPVRSVELFNSSTPEFAWLPGRASVRMWQEFVKPISLSDFAEKGGTPDDFSHRNSPFPIDLGELDIRKSSDTLQTSFLLDFEYSENIEFIPKDNRLRFISLKKHDPLKSLVTLGIEADLLSPGTFRSSFQIKQASGETRAFSVLARVIADYRATPPSLYVGVIPRGRISEMHVSIIDDTAEEVKITSIRSSRPAFAEAKVSEDGNLQCRFDGGNAFGNQSGHFDVTLGGEPKKRLKIPFVAWVSKQPSL